MNIPAISFQETNSILPADFHVLGIVKIESFWTEGYAGQTPNSFHD